MERGGRRWREMEGGGGSWGEMEKAAKGGRGKDRSYHKVCLMRGNKATIPPKYETLDSAVSQCLRVHAQYIASVVSKYSTMVVGFYGNKFCAPPCRATVGCAGQLLSRQDRTGKFYVINLGSENFCC